jgi:hypothetical protein
MRTLNRIVVAAVVAGLVGIGPASEARQRRAREQVITSRPQVARAAGAGAQDPDLNDEDAGAENPKPPEKGGPRSKGSHCGILVDNYTPYKVRVLVDGKYRGTAGPWGGLTVASLSGESRLTAEAKFAGGKVMTWANSCECTNNRAYRWKLLE